MTAARMSSGVRRQRRVRSLGGDEYNASAVIDRRYRAHQCSCTNRRNICLRLGVMRQTVFVSRFNCVPRSRPLRRRFTDKRPLSLGVIFLTLYIDLIGFSIIFPLGPTCSTTI